MACPPEKHSVFNDKFDAEHQMVVFEPDSGLLE